MEVRNGRYSAAPGGPGATKKEKGVLVVQQGPEI